MTPGCEGPASVAAEPQGGAQPAAAGASPAQRVQGGGTSGSICEPSVCVTSHLLERVPYDPTTET